MNKCCGWVYKKRLTQINHANPGKRPILLHKAVDNLLDFPSWMRGGWRMAAHPDPRGRRIIRNSCNSVRGSSLCIRRTD
jgi:hypothetical protein